MQDVKRRVQVAATKLLTRTLRLLGLRDRITALRIARQRNERLAAETRGEDRLSKPALYELDAKLNAIIDRDAGLFIEAGEHDGFSESNTYWLERFRSWGGVLV